MRRLTALLLLLPIIGCTEPVTHNNTLIYGRGGDADTLDPIHTSVGETVKVLVNIYDTLVAYDDETIVVYQAYRPDIAAYAVEHEQFGGPWSFGRMSWIKPNFL